MLLLGLTGSIATGKSTVSSLLSSPPYSLPVIDADLLARKVVEPGTAGYKAILGHFHSSTPDLLVNSEECGGYQHGPNGKGRPLNRQALGRRVFGEGLESDRKILNGIVHPAVRREMYKAMIWAYLRGNWAVVVDIPLLFESGWERMCGTVLVVAVKDPKVQMQRLRDRDQHLSEEDARNRVASQTDVREKARRAEARGNAAAGVVIWNDGDRGQLETEVARAMQRIKRGSPVWWSWFLLLCPPAAFMSALHSFWRCWRWQQEWNSSQKDNKAKL